MNLIGQSKTITRGCTNLIGRYIERKFGTKTDLENSKKPPSKFQEIIVKEQ